MTLLERYERRATILGRGRPLQYTPITSIGSLEDVMELANVETRFWKSMMSNLRQGGDPMGLLGNIAGLESKPTPDALTATTAATSEQQLWAGATWTAIEQDPNAPKIYELLAGGGITTGATPGTVTITPRIGTSITGSTLGASNAYVPGTSQTGAMWLLEGNLTIRRGGSGTNAAAYFTGRWAAKTTAAAGAIDIDLIFGYTAATFDSTLTGLALWITSTVSNTGSILTPQMLRWGSWN